MKYFVSFRWSSCILAAFIILFTGTVSAHAATIAVTTTTDELADPGPGTGCSLREAIQSVNGAANYGGCTNTGAAYGTSNTINIPAGTYTIAIAGADEYLNATGSFDILDSVTIVGAEAGSTTIDGGALDRVFFINGAYAVSISGVTITNGLSGGGSGIYNNGGELTVISTTIRNNTAIGSQSCAGGLAAGVSNPITVTNSTISGNSAGYCGGGILIWGSLTVTNSTISGNSAGSYGGGVFRGASGVGASIFTNSTISGNSGPNGGGFWNDGGGSVTLSNTIVANQTSGADCAGPISSNGHNLESAATCGFTGTGDLQNTNPQLVALASNGGPTQTMELPAGSPAIDAGSCEQATDQRGIARPQGIACDIGAYERESGLLSDLSITKTDGSTTYTPGGTAVYTVTVSNAGPSAVTNATVTDNLPSGVASWTWACTSQNGGASGCTGAAAGNSNFTDTVDLPVGGSIVYTVTANISGTMTANLVNIASIAPPNGTTDPNPNNDSATDTDARAQQAVAIPALSHVGFGVLALMLAFAAMFVLRRSAV